jgi:hypothetical protein
MFKYDYQQDKMATMDGRGISTQHGRSGSWPRVIADKLGEMQPAARGAVHRLARGDMFEANAYWKRSTSRPSAARSLFVALLEPQRSFFAVTRTARVTWSSWRRILLKGTASVGGMLR